MFKDYNNLTPQYIADHFTLRNNVLDTNESLRSSTAGFFVPPKPRTDYFETSLRYWMSVVEWSASTCKNAETPDTFHSRLY